LAMPPIDKLYYVNFIFWAKLSVLIINSLDCKTALFVCLVK